MPRPLPATATRPRPNSLIASAATLTAGYSRINRPRQGTTDWQNAAWHFHDTVGELRFGAHWMGNVLSRVRLRVMRTMPGTGGDEEVNDGPAAEAMEALYGGVSGQGQMLHDLGIHLFVPGEAYLIGEPPPEDDVNGDDTWGIYSTEEVKERGGVWIVDRGDGERELDPEALIIRIWNSHPRAWVEADSPVRAVLPVLREIEALTKHVGASVDSRLAGAGILMLPSEMTFGSPSTDGAVPEDPAEDEFLQALTEAMVTPISDRESAAAVVPIVVRAPGALLGNARHITFATPLDANAQALRTEAIRRLALGLDMPPEVLLGVSDANHWGAWQISEDALRSHVEPKVAMICHALTERYLRPVLEGAGLEPEDYWLEGDTSELRTRPNRTAEAQALYDRLELSGETLRRETGFDEGDAPSPEDLRAVLLRKIALGSTTPRAAADAARALGVTVTPPAAATPAAEDAPAALPAPTAPTTVPENRTNPPSPEQAAALAAGELLVLRAVERANNKVNRRGKQRRPFSVTECDTALADAWTYAPRVADLLGWDEITLVDRLDRYTRALLTEGVDHQPEVLARLLLTR